jgi:hypothetical protein
VIYQPNFNDARVQKRLSQALKFVRRYVYENKDSWLGTRYIDQQFGQQQTQLGAYLREHLLICVDNRYNKDLGQAKKYRRNPEGFEYLSNLLVNKPILKDVTEQFQQELDQGLVYKDSSDRLFHWIQNQRRDVKHEIFLSSGLTHNYDIQCAAPTLLLQYSQQRPVPMDLYLEHLQNYIKNRKELRKTIAEQADLTPQTIKILLNGLLLGQHLSTYTKGTTYELIQGDRAKIIFLQQHEFLKGFKGDISTMWSYIKPALYRPRVADKTGRIRTRPITARQKNALYRRLERQVLMAVDEYLKQTNNQYVLEHDGWITRDLVDQTELIESVRRATGFVIGLDYVNLNSDSTLSLEQLRNVS